LIRRMGAFELIGTTTRHSANGTQLRIRGRQR
jgi:hypothetical protein